MKKRYKTYLKLNLVSIFFIALSFLSATLAWFAYSGVSRTSTEINIKSWNISFDKNGQPTSNLITINVDDIYPGMDINTEKINIQNNGDVDAVLSYKIESARILSDNLRVSKEFGETEDMLANNYPFSINIGFDNKYLPAQTGKSTLNVSVSWPLDSDTDAVDSEWGNLAYNYKKENNSTSPLKIVINVMAEQRIDKYSYNAGDLVLYDPTINDVCDRVSDTCMTTHVLTSNYEDTDTIALLPELRLANTENTYENYNALVNDFSSQWTVNKTNLKLEHILRLLSEDLDKTILVRNGLSDRILGYINYADRLDHYLADKVINYDSYFKYDTVRYSFLESPNCYWLDTIYDDTKAFALVLDSEKGNIITPYDKTNTCKAVPVILVPKEKLYRN